MKRGYIYLIVIVLTIALLGLVYIQSIYIKQGLTIQNQIFDQYANEALVRTAIKLEQDKAFQLYENPQILDLYKNAKNLEGQCGINLQYKNGKILLDIEKEEGTYSFSANKMEEIDSMVKHANLGAEIESQLSNNILREYNEIMQNMTMELLYGNSESVFDSLKIFRTLNFELERMGITTPFEFTVLDGFTLRPILSNFKKFTAATQNNSYKTAIHTNPLTNEHAILLVNFPYKRSFLLKFSSKLLGFSFLFVFLIVASFGASIYIIFMQKKLSELKTDFINNMTHELKTPVATISLATQMLSKEKIRLDESKVANYTQIISDENNRLGTHIERVLQIAQIDKDKLSLKTESIDMHEVLQNLLEKFDLRMQEADAHWQMHLNADRCLIKGDKTHIINVFSNLIDNAIKYRSDRPLEISIKTENKNGHINIEITDNGIGLSDADSKKIFTKFYRVPTGNVHNVKGFGLGLSYVKTIVEAHKGGIKVVSVLDKYTTFKVEFPTISKTATI